jgi:hypothetical protein
MPRDVRFKEMSFYDKGTGQTVFLGPGSYNAHECFARLKQVPSPFIMVKFHYLNDLETYFPYPRKGVRRIALHNGRRLNKI